MGFLVATIFGSCGLVVIAQGIARRRRGIRVNRRAACLLIFGRRQTLASTESERSRQSAASTEAAQVPLTHFYPISTPWNSNLSSLITPWSRCQYAAISEKSLSFRMLSAGELASAVATSKCRERGDATSTGANCKIRWPAPTILCLTRGQSCGNVETRSALTPS